MENKLGRFFRNTQALSFCLVAGIALLVMGILFVVNAPDHYEEATGTVTAIREYEEETTEPDTGTRFETHYEVSFVYRVRGTEYNNSFDYLTNDYKVGDKITVWYNPEKPDQISNTKNVFLFGIIMIVAGAGFLFLGIFLTVRAFKKSKRLDQLKEEVTHRQRADGTVAAGNALAGDPLDKDALTEYYVSLDKKKFTNPGYLVEDRERHLVFEAPMTKNAMVGPRTFTFVDHLTHKTKEHAVGHTVTSRVESSATLSNSFFNTRSWFKFDGKNIWDYLHENGIFIETSVFSEFPRFVYDVTLNGQYFARIETCGQYVHEEDAEAHHHINPPIGKYYYRVWTNAADSEFEILFLTVFAISETEQTVVE